ncbi:MAG: hypothetical protein K2N26_07300 [Oscillospiraceae bacterium]|nr:hypothetical protein [Oscillospiraceae bacterium]MDE7279512.1 hypothetical protein [Oscillospiraceae bacterium]
MENNEYNVIEKEQRDTYDKFFGGRGNNIFSESGFDEMQKARNYEIGFRIFRVFFWAVYFMATAVMAAAIAVKSTLVLVIGSAFMAVCDLFYLLYAAKVSSLGVMNLDFAKRMSQKSILIVYIFVGVVWIMNLFLGSATAAAAIMMILLSILYIGLYICAKRNMKVLEKMLKDDSDSGEK